MDITNIANLATALSSATISDKVGMAVLKKALDTAAANALMLIQALPPVPSFNLPPNLGQNIDTTA